MKKLYVFTLKTCQRCLTLKNRLNEEGISYQEIDTIENNILWSQVVEQTKVTVVPTLFVADQNDEDTEGYVYVPGKDFDTDDDLIQKLKLVL